MQKSKLGISVGIVGAALYFAGLFNGLLLIAIIAGYVLFVEDNQWLRRTAVKSVVLYIFFALVSAIIGLLPDSIGFISSFFEVFGGSVSVPFVSSLVEFIDKGLSILKTVLFILLGFKALNQGTIVIPFIDSTVNKYI